MSGQNPASRILLILGTCAVVAGFAWQTVQVDRLHTELEGLAAHVEQQRLDQEKRWADWTQNDTRPAVDIEDEEAEPPPRPKSPSEKHGPRGPMPVSMAVESARAPNDPPPGSDVTSDIRVKVKRPCEQACRRLSRCAMDLPQCQSADTRSQHDFVEICYQRCRASSTVKTILLGETDCRRALEQAQASLDGFQEWCGRP